MRSILGRSRVTQRVWARAGLGSSEPPAAFQSSIPPWRYRAAGPRSRSALATPRLTSPPCMQYTTTLLARQLARPLADAFRVAPQRPLDQIGSALKNRVAAHVDDQRRPVAAKRRL